VTHHGSRGIGARVYRNAVKIAQRETAKVADGVPKLGSYLDLHSVLGEHYFKALAFVKEWTEHNHFILHERFMASLGYDLYKLTLFNEHNSIWFDGDTVIHGKGATYLPEGGHGIIPLSMKDPILLVRSHPDGCGVAPHGAGRDMSRSAFTRMIEALGGPDAKERFYQAETEGLDVRWFSGQGDITELGGAYKDAHHVKSLIEKQSLADIFGEIQPLGCMMAGR